MQKLTRSLAMASALAFAGVLAGCGDDVTVAPTLEVTVSPSSANVAVGASVTLTASVTGTNKNKNVTWSSSDASKATVDANGKVTGVAVGQTTVTATAAADAGVKSSALITVTTPNLGVQKVDVSPPNAILKAGDFLQATANVTRNPGVSDAVTWSSSAAAVATVDATGKITAVSNGAATITAKSTVDPTVSGSMALTVRPIQLAQISIQAVTQGGTTFPVNFNNVNGQIDVVLNVDPGEERVTKVDVLIDNVSACTRNLSASESEALRIAAAFEEAQAVDIVCSINTAEFAAATGIAKYLNGPRTLSASATIAGPPPRTTTATNQAVVFNNANGYAATTTFTGTTASATSAAGFGYRRGGVTVSILPVIYSGTLAIATGTLSYGSAACDASGTAQRAISVVAPAAGSSAWTATFPQTATGGAAASNVQNYEFSAVLCPAANNVGESVRFTAVDNQGNTLFAAMQPADSATRTGIRLDNRPPGAPTFVANPNSRQNGWINANVGMAGLNTSATDNDWLANGLADAGVGGYVRVVRQGAGPTVDAALADPGSTTPTLAAPSATNLSYCAVISAKDLLNNESALPAAASTCTAPPAATFTAVAAQSLSFGVDIAPPTIAFSGGLASNARIATATVAGEFQVTVTDTGTVGNSGMLSNASVIGTVQIRNAAGTTCFIGTVVATVCTPTSVNLAPAFPLVPTTTVAASGATGYFSYSAVSQDAAGNQSAPVTRVVAHDDGTNPANLPALTQALFNTPLVGPTVVFNANASDNFDLRDVTYTLTYSAGFVAPIQYPAVVLNTFNTPPLVNSNVPAGISISGFIRRAEAQTSACNAALAVGAGGVPTTLTGTIRDQANNLGAAPVATGIPGAAVPAGTSYAGVAAAQQIFTFFVQNGVTGCPTGAAVNAPVLVSTGATTPATNPLTVTLVADVYGPTATFNPPFTRVDFYVVSGGNLVQIASATGVSTVDDGSANGRRHRYTAGAWTPGTAFGTAAQTIYAVGVNGNGDALVTDANANVTTTNP
jgi:hypothetical protein